MKVVKQSLQVARDAFDCINLKTFQDFFSQWIKVPPPEKVKHIYTSVHTQTHRHTDAHTPATKKSAVSNNFEGFEHNWIKRQATGLAGP